MVGRGFYGVMPIDGSTVHPHTRGTRAHRVAQGHLIIDGHTCAASWEPDRENEGRGTPARFRVHLPRGGVIGVIRSAVGSANGHIVQDGDGIAGGLARIADGQCIVQTRKIIGLGHRVRPGLSDAEGGGCDHHRIEVESAPVINALASGSAGPRVGVRQKRLELSGLGVIELLKPSSLTGCARDQLRRAGKNPGPVPCVLVPMGPAVVRGGPRARGVVVHGIGLAREIVAREIRVLAVGAGHVDDPSRLDHGRGGIGVDRRDDVAGRHEKSGRDRNDRSRGRTRVHIKERAKGGPVDIYGKGIVRSPHDARGGRCALGPNPAN